jgi:hypothetical protein
MMLLGLYPNSLKNLESSDSDDSEHDKEESNEPDYDEGSARRRGNWTNDNKSGFLNSCLVHNKCNTCGWSLAISSRISPDNPHVLSLPLMQYP